MNFFFLLNLLIINLNYINANNFAATAFYGDNACKNINIVTYSYENLEICNNDIIDNKCNIINKLANFSTKGFCGSDSLENTKKSFNNDFIYMEIFDLNCTNKIGAISVTIDKCLSFMGQGYLKVIKNKKLINSKLYSDNICKNEIKQENIKNNQPIDLQKCSDKINIYTKDGLLKNDDDNSKNDDDNSKNDDDNNKNIENSSNNEKYSLILTLVLSIFISCFLFIQY
jgi:hypothetical protein